MAKVYRPYFPEQDFLLPPSLREWLSEDHLAYFVSDLIDQLDLSQIERHYEREERGYPAPLSSPSIRLSCFQVSPANSIVTVSRSLSVNGSSAGRRGRIFRSVISSETSVATASAA